MRGRDKFQKYKKIILLISRIFKIFPLGIRKKLLIYCRYTNGSLGYMLRYSLLTAVCAECGDNVSVAPGAYILNAQNLYLGNNISINPMCYIECGPFSDSCIKIDDDVSIAHGSTIICTSHTYHSDTTDIIKDMPVAYKPVHICKNVWIGAKSTILYGITIESGCVIGANSVVTKSTQRDGIYAGTPAQRIKER